MSDASQPSLLASPHAPQTPPLRPGRAAFIGFVSDDASATLLRACLQECHFGGRNGEDVHVAGFRAALAALAAMPTPEIVLVDLTGEGQPLNAVMELAEAVEEGTTVLAIGAPQNISFYRTVTKGLGIREYLAKPLSRAVVMRGLLPFFAHQPVAPVATRLGRLVAVAGARGGVGTTTVAANLAWYLATERHRHTAAVDGMLNTGTLGLYLDLPSATGLGAVLETPERVDTLLLERCVQDAGDRLHVLAGQEPLTRFVNSSRASTVQFIQAMRARYNFIIADAGAQLEPFARDLLLSAAQRIIVMDPSLISVRNLARLTSLPGQAQTLLVLNRAGTPGGITQKYLEEKLGLNFAAVIPDLPRIVPRSTQLGTPAAALRGPFRDALAALAAAVETGRGMEKQGANAARD